MPLNFWAALWLSPVSDVEGIELIQRPFSTFKDMVSSLYEAEKMGACCWIVDCRSPKSHPV